MPCTSGNSTPALPPSWLNEMMTNSQFDVVIVGGGPGGCAAALHLLRQGLKVALLDSAPAPRRKPGETLHPGIETVFRSVGIDTLLRDSAVHRHRGIYVAWNEQQRFQPYGEDEYGPWHGFQFDRRTLETMLLRKVQEAGGTVYQNCKAEKLQLVEGRCTGVITPNEALKARWTIDATGGQHWLANQLDLEIEWISKPLVIRFGWQNNRTSDTEPRLTATEGGWKWQAPIGKDATAWCDLRLGDSRNRDLSSSPHSCDVSWRIVPECAGPGYFMVGDAAMVLDPLSSHGVLRAMMTGIQVSQLIQAQFNHTLTEEQVIASYRKWMNHWFQHDKTKLVQLYHSHPQRLEILA